ncbi:GNAT family N-acetyltransferase [Meiothermus granaticius]|uniref:Ribosomal-protein-alanine acetyltransferase n=1 Tax=Meiothermus granaticius NBRC 107808 TaxID=1227551 RepID=A0A399F8G9_9DEIN|nr:GNAT family N-acetyltransferase [Meiothermus granaticius]MCL6525353.1 GNAT family N-acetyltransferase [Thermaceae bacterium]RIH92954.1 ribosomal-protein-alanine acetyltransferase [Meiothermus granaticius NBRC 107808]GEM86208.1 N-acetyltransferase [Meiothermus granaticius NBRC 107808]
MKTAARLELLPVTPEAAAVVHELYLRCPTYIALIGGDTPTLNDIQRELETLRHDTRRQAYLLFQEGKVIGFLDYKVAYPDLHSATVSLLLIDERLQNQGLGKLVVEQLEQLLSGRTERLFAVVYGNNEKAKAFWKRQGYTHAHDGGPSLSWYVKNLSN